MNVTASVMLDAGEVSGQNCFCNCESSAMISAKYNKKTLSGPNCFLHSCPFHMCNQIVMCLLFFFFFTDQVQLDTQINKLRSELKVKVNTLRDMEFQSPVPGLMLSPLSRAELSAMGQTMGRHA